MIWLSHLGHRHRIRCLRKGINPATALVTPLSSSSPSRSPSECSFPQSSIRNASGVSSDKRLVRNSNAIASATLDPVAQVTQVAQVSQVAQAAPANQTSLLGSPYAAGAGLRQEVRTSLMGNPFINMNVHGDGKKTPIVKLNPMSLSSLLNVSNNNNNNVAMLSSKSKKTPKSNQNNVNNGGKCVGRFNY